MVIIPRSHSFEKDWVIGLNTTTHESNISIHLQFYPKIILGIKPGNCICNYYIPDKFYICSVDSPKLTIIPEDALLFSRIQASDSKVFEFIYHKYFELLCRYAYGFMLDRSLSEDMVNDSFLELWEKRVQIKINSSLKAYLLITVRNKSLNLIRRRKMERNYQLEQVYLEAFDKEVSDQLEKFLQMEALESKLNKAIENLPPQCREIFRLNRFSQLSYQEIADQMNLSVFTVKTQISRALKSLRHEFENIKLLLFNFLSKK